MQIIVKRFEPHYNRALGKVVTSQRQYNDEMKRGGYISHDECNDRVKSNLEKQSRFSVSDDAVEWMQGVKAKADKKGNVRLSDKEISALKTKGMAVDRRLPEHYREKGGFE